MLRPSHAFGTAPRTQRWGDNPIVRTFFVPTALPINASSSEVRWFSSGADSGPGGDVRAAKVYSRVLCARRSRRTSWGSSSQRRVGGARGTSWVLASPGPDAVLVAGQNHPLFSGKDRRPRTRLSSRPRGSKRKRVPLKSGCSKP